MTPPCCEGTSTSWPPTRNERSTVLKASTRPTKRRPGNRLCSPTRTSLTTRAGSSAAACGSLSQPASARPSRPTPRSATQRTERFIHSAPFSACPSGPEKFKHTFEFVSRRHCHFHAGANSRRQQGSAEPVLYGPVPLNKPEATMHGGEDCTLISGLLLAL